MGVPKSLLERVGDNPEKGVDVEMGRGCHFFIALQFNCIYKCTCTNFFKYPANIFLNTENVLVS